MSKIKSLTSACLIGGSLFFSLFFPLAMAQETDRVTGLILSDGWQAVQANCTECHSAQLIIQNSGSREVWKSRILWMQQTQGLHELGAELEDTILGYLAGNYGQKQAGRRAPLPAGLLPENPYGTNN